MDGGIYSVNLDTLDMEEIAENLSPKAFSINETGTMAAWMTEGAELGAKVIELENFETMIRNEIKADSGKLLRQLGFMGTDLVYGIANEEDVSVDFSRCIPSAFRRKTVPFTRIILRTDIMLRTVFLKTI